MSDTAATRRPPPTERRAQAIDAFIDLLLEGRMPKPEDVADRADLSIATLYRYFSTLDELRHDAMTRVLDRYPNLFTVPDIGEGPRHERIHRFVSARLDLHETLHPLELFQRAAATQDAGAAEMVHTTRRVLADQARTHFDQELQALQPAQREATVATLEMLTSVESWHSFRKSHDQSLTRTRQAWTDATDRLLPAD